MTTAAPLINNTQFSVNMTTKSQEQSLYQSSGAIVAAIVVGVIIIFTVVLLILKTYNRRMRAKRELEPKTTTTAMPPALGQNSHSMSQHPTVTFIPVDIHMHNRKNKRSGHFLYDRNQLVEACKSSEGREPSYRAPGMERPNKPSPFVGREDAHSDFVELLLTRRV